MEIYISSENVRVKLRPKQLLFVFLGFIVYILRRFFFLIWDLDLLLSVCIVVIRLDMDDVTPVDNNIRVVLRLELGF